MKTEEIVEYHIFALNGKKFVTDSYEEAKASFEEGRAVYEVHTVKWQAEWVTTATTISHEWH